MLQGRGLVTHPLGAFSPHLFCIYLTLQIFRGCCVLVVKSKINHHLGSPGGAVVKNPLVNAGDTGLFPGSGRSPGGGNGNPLQYSCLENPMDRGARWASVHGNTKSSTVERLSMQAHANHHLRKILIPPTAHWGAFEDRRNCPGEGGGSQRVHREMCSMRNCPHVAPRKLSSWVALGLSAPSQAAPC